MLAFHQFAIMAAAFLAPLSTSSGEGIVPIAHFALIKPEADTSNEQPEPIVDGVWLRRPRKGAGTVRKVNSLLRSNDKSAAAVSPLKRDRPKRETDPPKTRRRQLGW